MSDTTGGENTFETREDAGKGDAGTVKYWLEAIDLAGRMEKDWRDSAEDCEAIYQSGTKANEKARRRYNILYSNTETLAAAIYNSTPIPDIRRRFSEGDDASRHVATALERCISYTLDQYDPDIVFRGVVKDGLLPGRGLLRVKYHQPKDTTPERVSCEGVDWRSFRRGPALAWDDIKWMAFRHYLPREELVKLNPRIGRTMGLDHDMHERQEKGDGQNEPDVFKRALVWEIWDKETREVVFIAPEYKSAPLVTYPDPLKLAQFFPVPRPFQPVELANELCPIAPFKLYRALADELEELTIRITRLTKAIRWRGAYADPKIGQFLTKFETLDDGELAPMDNPTLASTGMDKAFWFQPIREAAETLIRLYEAREQIKQAIYEVTGIADLLRGSSQASETATAQNIKAQWGALRVSTMQTEIQRLVRDVIRLKVEIIAEHFPPQTLMAMSGMQLDEAAIGLMKSEPMRRYRVDVETDSTIRADLQRQQQNISQFVQGFGQFIQSVGPAVQAGAMPMNVVSEMVKSFSRVFKLGRAVEEALDSLPQQAPEQADPNAAAQQQAQMEMQAKQQELQMKAQGDSAKLQADTQIKMAEIQATTEREKAKLAFEQQKHADQMQIERERLALDAASKSTDHDMRREEMDVGREHADRDYGLNARKAEFEEAASGVRRKEDGSVTTAEEEKHAAEAATQKELANAAKAQAQAADRIAKAIEAAGKAAGAPKRVVRGQGRDMRIEPVAVN